MGGQRAIHSPSGPQQWALKEGWAEGAVEPGSSSQEPAEGGTPKDTCLEAAQRASHGMAREEAGCWKHLAG